MVCGLLAVVCGLWFVEGMDMSEDQANDLSVVKGHKYLSLTTFRKSGKPVATPVWFVEKEGQICVWTQSNSGKMKRLRHNSKVMVAPCTMRGKVIGLIFRHFHSLHKPLNANNRHIRENPP